MTAAEEFYQGNGLNAASYDTRLSLTGSPVHGDTAFFVELANELGGAVLELGTGTGRVALAIAEATDLEVVGLDLSAPMLAQANAKLAANPRASRAKFYRGNMARFAFDQKFALIVIPFRGFQVLLTSAQQRACLACMRDHLAPGGRVVIDLFDPKLEYCVPGVDQTPKPRPGGRNPATGNQLTAQVLSRINNAVTQVLLEEWQFTEVDADGTIVAQDTETLTLRWTYRYEMRHLFELEGFTVVAEYSDFEKTAPAYAKDMVFVARASDS